MARLSEEAKRDIAQKFDLPERRSKIASLLKQNDQIYCLCRSSDAERFMIACDSCEEWYHGDCIDLTESQSKCIKQYFCPICVKDNPDLKIVYKKPKREICRVEQRRLLALKNSEKKSRAGRPPKSKDDKKCLCVGCLMTSNCGHCSSCIKRSKGYPDKRPCDDRMCIKEFKAVRRMSGEYSSDEDFAARFEFSDSEDEEEKHLWLEKSSSSRKIPKVPNPKIPKDKEPKAKKPKSKVTPKKPVVQRKRKKPTRSSSSDSDCDDRFPSNAPRQCYGPDCTNPAKPKSKYCSFDCGIALAHARIYALLPFRMAEWEVKAPSAEVHNKAELSECRRKYTETLDELRKLNKKRDELQKHITSVTQMDDSDSSEEEHEEEGVMHCVTCGHEISMRTCLKHMEKCYNKYESQTTFGSAHKTNVEGPPLFCDFYNPVAKQYCKRLQVLCAEHAKQPKVGDKEFCGFPLEKEGEPSSLTKFCRVRKKKCNKHFCWEKLRYALIDMDRVRQYLKLDDLLDKETKLRSALRSRAGVMGLLLNSTFDHELQDNKEDDDAEPEREKSPEGERMEEESETESESSETSDSTD